jgi:hypothetical protein
MAWLRRPLPAALLLVLLWTLCRLAFLARDGIRQPEYHDEFCYLLGADTFAHGRLANPPHPLANFFEAPNVLVRPAYASKYPPGQALFLALGQRLFGSPFYGVILGNDLILLTFCLMLYAWVPYPWALAVSGMVACCLQPGMYWTNSYWGGSVAASGGALVLLGIGMYRTRPTPLAGVAFALGALLLFWTRPLEGGVFTLTALLVFAKELWSKRSAGAWLAVLLIIATGGAWTCYYNQAVTGSPLQLPYAMYEKQYNVQPIFWFLPLRPEPTYANPRIASTFGINGVYADDYRKDRRWPRGVLLGFATTIWRLVTTLGATLLFTLVVPVAWRDPRYRKMAIVTGVFLLLLCAEVYHFQHYGAPDWAALALMIAVWAQHVWNLRFRKLPVGAALVILALIASPASVALHKSMSPPLHDWTNRRAAMIARLSTLDRPQLVIVSYPAPEWNSGIEWVYNGADIDGQRVVFARDRGTEENRALLKYYPDRQANLLTFDRVSVQDRLDPYPPQ